MSAPVSRRPLLVAGALLVVLVALVALTRDGDRNAAPLDPDNPRPEGSQALARVLADQGVDVAVVRGREAFGDADAGAGDLVVVTNPDALGRTTYADVRRTGARVVLVGSGPVVADLVGGDAAGAGVEGEVAARCDDPLWDGLVLDTPLTFVSPGDGCFASGGSALLRDAGPRVQVFSAPEVLANDTVLRADNAAVALRLLGQGDRLVWYVADTADTTASDGRSLLLFLPPWTAPALLLAGWALLLALVWRARRLGPLVTEPLPVRVRAVETAESRGRLYRRAHDRGHAATILAAATRRRLATPLGLRPDVDPEAVVAAAAHATGRATDDVRALLVPDPPDRDHDLTRLGQALLILEEEVRHR